MLVYYWTYRGEIRAENGLNFSRNIGSSFLRNWATNFSKQSMRIISALKRYR